MEFWYNSLVLGKVYATLAQLVERLIRNEEVAGSIPAGGSKTTDGIEPGLLRSKSGSRIKSSRRCLHRESSQSLLIVSRQVAPRRTLLNRGIARSQSIEYYRNYYARFV